jgi:hypothetical protein
LVQERVGNTLELIGIGKNFLNRTPAAQQSRDSIDKWDFIKLKSFCSTKKMKLLEAAELSMEITINLKQFSVFPIVKG